MKTLIAIAALAIVGCATVDPNYALAMKAYSEAKAAEAAAQKAQADTAFELARSIEEVGKSGSEPVKMQSIMALALIRVGQGNAPLAQTINVPVPPESAADKALRFVGALAPIAVQGYGIWANNIATRETARLNAAVQTNAQNTNAQMFRDAGNANTAIAGAGINALATLGAKGYDSLGGIVETLGKPITASDGGIIVVGSTGAGSVVGSGRVGNTSNNCASTSGASPATGAPASAGNAAAAVTGNATSNQGSAAPGGAATSTAGGGGTTGSSTQTCKG